MKHEMQTDDNAVSPVIGVILMVAITVVLAAIVFVLVTKLSAVQDQTPSVSFTAQDDGATLMVVKSDDGLNWADFTVAGCTTVPTGTVDAGDKLETCGATVTVKHNASNSLIYSR